MCVALVALCSLGWRAEAQPPPEAPPPEVAETRPSLGQALSDGELAVSLRYRFEHVDDDASAAAADASTLRASIGYRTLPYRGLSAQIEFSAVTTVGAEDRFANAGAGASANGVTGRPVVADPEMTRVNQISGSFERGATRVSAGRLELALDDQRFVGPVKWRQNYQTFAAARLESRAISGTTFNYAFVERAYTITGAERPMASHVINLAVELPAGTAVGYAYLLDFENEAEAGQSTSTYGLRFSGQRSLGKLRIGYEAAYAHQRDRASNPSRVRADYYRLMASAGPPELTLEVGYESLGGSAEDGRFTTPLATLHAFNGWADKFLATPLLGLEDLSVGLRGKAGPLSWGAVFHDFGADSGGAHYGRELDLVAVYQTPWRQSLGVKAALYDARELSTDTTKVWVWSAYSF
jgi:hypothetical protein